MAEQIYFEDVEEGDSIPSLEKNPTSQQLVYWAAGSGDFYQIHYDTKYAQDTGLPNIIVHGALKHAFLGELLWRFASPEGQVKRVQCSYRGMDPAVQGKDDLVDQKFTLERHRHPEVHRGREELRRAEHPGRPRRRQHFHARHRHRHPAQPRLTAAPRWNSAA